MREFAIRTMDLSRDFGPTRALDRLSIEAVSGEIFGFLGPNGAGKTTTINLLLGLLEPSEGCAEVLGFDTRKHAARVRARAGALLEDTGLYEQMSAADNLEFYGRVWHMSAAERKARTKELLTGIGLWDRRNESVGKWSKGMQQKLALARAVFHRPELIFLDEPTAGLDVMSAVAVREDLAALASHEGVTVFLTTHNMAEAEKLAHRVAVIRGGQLVAMGAPDALRASMGGPRMEVTGRDFSEGVLSQLRKRPEVAEAVAHNSHLSIRLRHETDAAVLVGLLVREGAQVEEVRRGKASLEEVFITLMEEER